MQWLTVGGLGFETRSLCRISLPGVRASSAAVASIAAKNGLSTCKAIVIILCQLPCVAQIVVTVLTTFFFFGVNTVGVAHVYRTSNSSSLEPDSNAISPSPSLPNPSKSSSLTSKEVWRKQKRLWHVSRYNFQKECYMQQVLTIAHWSSWGFQIYQRYLCGCTCAQAMSDQLVLSIVSNVGLGCGQTCTQS